MTPPTDERALDRLRRAVSSMPELTRAVFERVRYERRDYADVAAEFEIEILTVERHVAFALIHLHKALYERDGSEPSLPTDEPPSR